jgi:hypothetical protein
MAAFYRATLTEFLADNPNKILGALLGSYQHNELQKRQTQAWQDEIEILKSAVAEILRVAPTAPSWSLLLEYPIPRRLKRLDAVLLAGDIIFCLESSTKSPTIAAEYKYLFNRTTAS